MTLGIITGLTAEARLAHGLGIVMAGGGTPAGAERAAAALLRQGVTGLLSFGLAGGLNPSLRAGAVVVPASVIEHGMLMRADPAMMAWLGGASHGLLVSQDEVVVSAAAKIRLHEATGAAAVDLESGAVARAARRAGIPFAVLRAVCDPAERTLPPAALLALDGGGAISLMRVLASLAGRPAQLPALLGLARDAARARAALVGRVHDIRAGGGFDRRNMR